MRTLKFRLVKDNKVVSTQELKPNGIIDCPVEWDSIYQFTGLFDKQGKEIYEGDIIQKLYKGEPERSFPSYIIIEWGFHSDHSSYMYQLGWNLWEDEEYKVVGNIYENPELLTK